MQTIRCAACGRRYDYRREGCCPHCGAYNRPPRREWVGADGSVHHGEDRNQARPEPGKVCYEEKVCYEDKQCFEEQARKYRKKGTSQATQNGEQEIKSFQKRFSHSKGKVQNNSVGALVFCVILIIAILIIKGLVGEGLKKVSWDSGVWGPNTSSPAYNYEKTIEGYCGDAIWINDDLAMQFLGYLSDEEGQVYLFYLTNDDDLAMTLLEDSYITIEEDENIHYGSSEVYYGHIEFNTCVPDAQWQTLRIESYDCQMIIRDLTPIEDSSTAAEFLQ